MTVNNVRSTIFTLHKKTQDSINRSQSTMTKLSNQLSSLQKTDSYIDLGENMPVEPYLNSKNIHSFITNRGKNNDFISREFSEKERQIGSLSEVTQDVIQLIMKLKNPGAANSIDEQSQANQLLLRAENHLNHSFGGKFVFGGSKTSTLPVSDVTTITNVIAGNPTANYYGGDDYTRVQQISSNQTIADPYHAGHQTFQNLIASLNIIKQCRVGPTTIDSPTIDSAFDLINQTKDDLGDMIIELGTISKAIDTQITNDNSFSITLNTIVKKAEDVDLAQATLDFPIVIQQLTASYMLMARIASLSIVDYLK